MRRQLRVSEAEASGTDGQAESGLHLVLQLVLLHCFFPAWAIGINQGSLEPWPSAVTSCFSDPASLLPWRPQVPCTPLPQSFWNGHLLYSLLVHFSILLSQYPHWASGKTNPPPCLLSDFTRDSLLLGRRCLSHLLTLNPAGTGSASLAAAGLSPYHLSFCRLVGCAPFKPSAVTVF